MSPAFSHSRLLELRARTHIRQRRHACWKLSVTLPGDGASWHRSPAPSLAKVFNRPCFTEGEYGRYRQKVGLCYLNVCELSQEMETEWPCTSARLVTREGCLLGPLVARRPGCARRIGASCLSSIHSGIVLSFPKVVWSFDGRS